MISSLTSPPESIWYTFSFVSGYFVDAEGFHWQAHNPNYDPGPPPPPRPPREPKQTDGDEIALQDKGKDALVVAENAPNFRRKGGGQLPRGTCTRKRQFDQPNVDSGAGSVGSSSQFRPHLSNESNIHHQSRQQRRQHKNVPQRFHPPSLGPSSQVPLQHSNGPQIHYQLANMPQQPHLPSVESTSRVGLQRFDGTDIHLPHRQQWKPPRYPHPPSSRMISPQLQQVNAAFSTMPTGSSMQFPLPVGLTPDNATLPRSPSIPAHVNSLPPPPADLSRQSHSARRAHPNKRTNKP